MTRTGRAPTTGHQPLNGILLVDKPKGLTSFRVVSLLRKHFSVKKVGHGGTLDPDATGLLILLFGKATKISRLFLEDDKTYEGVIVFGKETDTYDASGKVVREAESVNLGEGDIKKTFEAFEGTLEQAPPPFSAVKVKGKKAYELARKGQKVELKKRTVKIYYLKLNKLETNGSLKAYFSAKVSKGTYIRSLAHDIGKKLGVGAYLGELKRTSSGQFLLKDAFNLEEVLKWSLNEGYKRIRKLK